MHERTGGILSVLASALLFAVSAAGAKYLTTANGGAAVHVTMARFIFGLIISIPMIIRDPKVLRPKSPLWVGVRAAAAVGAVLLFFYGIQHTMVSKANLLNMTYPVFVFAIGPAITRERAKPISFLLLAVMMVGVWTVVRPQTPSTFGGPAIGDLLAFASAAVSGIAIAALRRARATDDSKTIVFYAMALGAVANVGIVAGLPIPTGRFLLVAGAAGLAGTLGQYALTYGFAHVTATTGSLVSTSRIVIAGVLGVLFFGDALTPRILVGSAIIVAALVASVFLDRDHSPRRSHREAPQ